MDYNLAARTKSFSGQVMDCARKIKLSFLNKNIVDQLLRSATSVGANYQEAIGAISKKDFRHKIHLCKKEIQETKYWIELLAQNEEKIKPELRILWLEAHELTLIFNKACQTLKKEE
jgi:four helix bundle protein